MGWEYRSVNFAGNVHQTVSAINSDAAWSVEGWELIALEFNGGGYTIAVFKRLRVT